ncbi:hypothetical protein ACHAQJ_006750 [Trichoderma viride]
MATQYDQYTWQQVRPGVWQRPVDEIEQLYAVLAKLNESSGRMFFAITGHISLTFDYVDSSGSTLDDRVDAALRNAWLALRHDHPTIASQVKYNTTTNSFAKIYHTIPTIPDQEAWLSQTFVKISTGHTGTEWANSDPPAPEIPTLFVITPPVLGGGDSTRVIHRDLVLRAPHDIIDGIGTLLLLGNIVNLASKAYDQGTSFQIPTFDEGSEIANMSPPFRVAARVSPRLTEEQSQRLAKIVELKKQQSMSDIPLLTIPWRQGAVVPGRHQRVALQLSKEKTLKLLRACSAIGVTATHVFHASIPIMMRNLQERGAKERNLRYVSYLLRNERGNCIEPYNSAKHPAALYHSGSGTSLLVDMILPAAGSNSPTEQQMEDKEFFNILQQMKKFYHEVRDDADHYQLALHYWASGTPQLPSGMEAPLPVPPPNPQPSASISSMGAIDRIIPSKTGEISVFDPWVTGEELRSGLGFFLGTYREELCLSAAYNDAWHDKEEVEKYLSMCMDIASKGLASSMI